ncbi:MAG: histidine kinase [Bacillota bacterium]
MSCIGVTTLTPKNIYNVVVYFEVSCEIENVMAFAIISKLKKIADIIEFYPDIAENSWSTEIIRKEGLKIKFKTDCSLEELRNFFTKTIQLGEFEIGQRSEGENDKGIDC